AREVRPGPHRGGPRIRRAADSEGAIPEGRADLPRQQRRVGDRPRGVTSCPQQGKWSLSAAPCRRSTTPTPQDEELTVIQMQFAVRQFRLFTCASTRPPTAGVGFPEACVELIELAMHGKAKRTRMKISNHIIKNARTVSWKHCNDFICDQRQ